MDIEVLAKVLFFWFIFYITPGPVWLAVMAATSKKDLTNIFGFFLKIFLPVNILIQVTQAIISVVFVDLIIKMFGQIGWVFYFLGALYIFYLALKALKAGQVKADLELTFINLTMIMLLSPKIWLLFPSGAVIANNLSQSIFMNAGVFVLSMFLVSSVLFFFYVFVGKVGAKILKDNFSYLVFVLLSGFSVFLFIEGFNSI